MTDPKDTLKSATEDLALIRNTMDRSRYHFDFLSTVFLIYGAVMLAGEILAHILSVCGVRDNAPGFFIVGYLPYVFVFLLFVFYFVMRRKFIKSETLYSLHLYDVWGVVLFFLPFLSLCFSLSRFFVPGTEKVENVGVIGILFCIKTLLFLFAALITLLFTAIALRDTPLLLIALICLLLFLFVLFRGFFVGYPRTIDFFYGELITRTQFLERAVYLLYVVLGLYLKIRKYK